MPTPTAPRVEYPTFLAAIRSESARFGEVLATCDPAARVPACPEWDAADLLWHLTGVQRFWAGIVSSRPAPPDPDAPELARPTSYDGLLEAFAEHSAALVDALAAADPGEPAWHWAPTQTVGTSYRRQAHEALIHRLDAEQTAGAVTPPDPELAADGVLEALDVMYGGDAPAWGAIDPGPHLVRVDLTDLGDAIWTRPGTFRGTDPESGHVYDGPHLQVVADPDTSPDAVLSGTAADLDAWLWHRRDDSVVRVAGDPAAYAALRAAIDQSLD
ncbi:maleylpyruvate isomerase family mycothiol-dependent enzyme [Nocardioides sp. zg-DK7169]|uniref:maleylpyruvate isomerase family mycothiol-dependent enzyme n=1 Tax=Nocardioides sp. zg-DK7169 TaxID=2736600 RepID=UPI00155511D2|nr:maleylpyruvate isomerase family mycothiol-dependent enzyme [Nocardioides sp. zg-DK7169]NPC99080.1 maleylpyruvate isomerase family mycothiol-dependent enzyme [Nocardioides sp. zg-DK7169]